MRTAVSAAVLNTVGQPLDFETLQVDQPAPDEVRVRPLHVGLCHSDLHYIDGTHHTRLPEVLGHEAAGVVEAVGANVTTVSVGDRVVTSMTMFCGSCSYCIRGRLTLCSQRDRLRARAEPALLNSAGVPVGAMAGIGAFCELMVIHRNGVVAVPDSIPLHVAALFGCAVLTGVGAVTRGAQVPVGATVAVIGCGGIGLAAIQGAQLAGASRIIAVDTSTEKLDAARRFGATDVVTVSTTTREDFLKLVPAGVDFSFEAVGRQETAELAFAVLAPGGTCTVLGMVPDETPIRIPASALYFEEKRLMGAFIGSSRPSDVAQLSDLYGQGRLMLDEMITHRISFAEINEGFALLQSGQALRVVMDMPQGP
jgi:S-(hydroxymethyl)glutathione dehydrogenase / alcohol dehydrogenase